MSKVRVILSFKTTANFNSAGLELGVVEEDVKSDETIGEALDRVYSLVEDKFVVKYKELKQEIKN